MYCYVYEFSPIQNLWPSSGTEREMLTHVFAGACARPIICPWKGSKFKLREGGTFAGLLISPLLPFPFVLSVNTTLLYIWSMALLYAVIYTP